MGIVDSYYSQDKQPKRFYQHGLFYGSLVAGIIVGFVIAGIGLVVLGSHGALPKNISQAKSGNITISMDDPLLTTGMRLALKRVQNQLPFTVSDVAAQTQAGDRVVLNVTTPGPVGINVGLKFVLAPTIDSTGHIDFKVIETDVGPLNISFAVNSMIEDSLNQQFANFGQGELVQGLTYQLIGVSTTNAALVLNARLTSSS